ncbi:MAG: AMP-binding protein, partial [Hamadaea sp.]|nr:AMP-binding protein [Hamadaea sp.]
MRPSISYGGDLPDDPDHPLTLGDALVRAAQRFPQAGLHIAPDGFQTYPQLLAAASRVATGLREAGARHGDYAVLRIGDDQYFPVFWGCVLSGVIPVTTGAPPGYEQDSPALTAITHTWDRLGRPLVLGGSGEVAGLRRLPLSGSVVDVAELLAAAESRPAPAAGPDDVAMLQLSSGSTGHPKIIQITHRGVSEYAIGARTLLDVRAGDVLLNWLPLDHVAGLMLYHLGGVFLGATTVQAATDPILADPPHWLELMEQYRATHGWAPNFAYRLVADALATSPGRRFDLSRVRRMVSGGEQCTPETFTAFVQACRPFGVSEAVMAPGWGMSETCTGITFASFGEPYCVQGDLLSVGPPAPGTTLRIVDGEQTVVPEGEVGRLQVRSARITPGYIDDPEADRIAFPEPGWLDSGDLAYMVDGRITVTGRAKDLVILNGHNYPCHEIERVAHDVDGIADRLVAACGVPDEHSGTERLVVFYAPAAGADHRSVKAAISAAIGRRLHLPVADVVAVPVEQFPRTGSGKIQRARLRDRYQARPPDPAPAAVPHERAVAAYPDVHRVVLEAVAALAGGPVDPQRAFYELGLGSVQMVQLRARLEEELGRPVPQPALFAHPTVQALATHLATGSEPGAGPTPQRPQADQRIAIVGMACRFPGADGVGQYWANLTGGVSSIRHFTKADLAAAGLPETLTGDPDFVAASGALDDVTGFDAGFFGVSAREAELLDPQQRLFLQICHHALEDAGLAGPTDLRIGLYAGSGMNLYPHHTYLRNNLAAAATSADPATSIGAALGNQPDFLATRVAYRLGLTGPAVNVQTACSTSLVAVHLAAQALLAGEADVAVAGASAIHVPQVTGYHYSPDSILSPDGTCRPFDAAAAGTVGGNGVAAVVLKPLANAMADGDAIHAVLLGSAINNDGATKVGFTAPGLSGQVKVIQAALQRAQVAPETVGYVEAHGTGTALGDPIEFAALSQAYPGGPRHLGSVKANLGHLDSCAGMAGLIKAILVVREGVIPPQINFTAPNPAVDLDRGQFTIATRRSTWPQQASPRRAGVSALGVGGTNAHVIVEQPPPPTAPVEGEAPGLLPLSAADPVALTQLADAYAEEIGVLPHADVVVSAATGRRHLRHRAVAVGSSTADLARQLAQPQQLIRGEVPPAGIGPVAFAYPGQGTDPQRGFTLAARFAPVGRWWRLLPAHVAARLRDGDRATDVVQPALVALGLGLTDLWRSWGVRPGSVLGHSVGELTALAAAGGLSGQDAVHIAAARGRLMQQLPAGAMAAVFAPRAAVDELLAATPGLELAAVNAAEQSVVAGPPDAVDRAAASGVPMRRLGVRRAFHTSAVDAILDEFRQVLAEVDFRPITVPFAGGVDGTVREPGWIPTAEYLCRQARRPVLFADAVGAIPTGGTTVVEAGPDAVLTGIAGMTGDLRWIASQPAGSPPVAGIWQAAAQLYCAGADLDWPAMTAGSGGRRVRLPRYPFQHRTYWVTAAAAAAPVPTGDDGVATARETAVTATPAAEANQTDAGLVARIVTMTAAKIGLEPAQVGPGDTFFSIGADSLLLVSLAREVQAEFGVRVPVRDLFDEVNTPARLAAVVAAATGGPPAAQPAMVSVAAAAPAAVVPSPPAGGEPRPATTGGAADGQPGAPADPALVDVVHRQLEIMQQQLALLGRPAAPAGP